MDTDNLIAGIIVGSEIIAVIYSLYNYTKLIRIKLSKNAEFREEMNPVNEENLQDQDYKNLAERGKLIKDGVVTFILELYLYIGYFVFAFGILVFLFAGPRLGNIWTTASFFLGVISSLLTIYISLRIAVYTNVRGAKKAFKSVENSFQTILQGASCISYLILPICLMCNHLVINLIKDKFEDMKENKERLLYYSVCGFGLGTSFVALFGRISGGIFNKAADVGNDMIGRMIKGLDENSSKNPGVLADQVGDNAGDIVGFISNVFSTYSLGVCAYLLALTNSPESIKSFPIYSLPFSLLALSLPFTIMAAIISQRLTHANNKSNIERILTLKSFLLTLFMTPLIALFIFFFLPAEIKLEAFDFIITKFDVFICISCGLWGGYIIGTSTGYFTSYDYYPVQEVAISCHTGSATDIIYGLALGYLSTIFPILILIILIYIGIALAGMFGICLIGIGMLILFPSMIIDNTFAPISDNAEGIADVCKNIHVRDNTLIIHDASKLTASNGRVYLLAVATVISLAIFGAFTTYFNIKFVDLLKPLEFAGLVIGAVMPYVFSSLTLKSVSIAAREIYISMKNELDETKINDPKYVPSYMRCIAICTSKSLSAMLYPVLLVVIIPFLSGLIGKNQCVCSIIGGIIVSGVQMAISFVNSGQAWDNAMNYIANGQLIKNRTVKIEGNKKTIVEEFLGKDSEEFDSAVIGDQVGDACKSSSGPSLAILMELTCILALMSGYVFS